MHADWRARHRAHRKPAYLAASDAVAPLPAALRRARRPAGGRASRSRVRIPQPWPGSADGVRCSQRGAAAVIVIHPGMVKTATSTLQKHGFARHPEVHFLGTPAASDELDWAIREVGRADSLYYDQAAVSDVFRRALAVAPASRTVVLSYENYAFYESKDKGQVGARLKTLFPGAKILFTLRRQQDLVVSLYLTRLRHHIERKTYLPFDEWFRVAAREPHLTALDDLRFQTIISHYVKLFGREQVGILLFEEL